MILINLLPVEHRQKKRAPLKFLAVVTASAAINASLAAFWAWTAFGVAAEVEAELAVLRDTKSGLEPQVAYHRDLETETKIFESREATLNRVTESRVSWSAQVDALVDLINRGGGGEGDKYLVWLDGLSVDMKENARANSYGSISAQAHSGSANFTHVANFLEDIERSSLARNFNKPLPPTGTAAAKDEGLQPAEIWNFPFAMTLKAPKERDAQ